MGCENPKEGVSAALQPSAALFDNHITDLFLTVKELAEKLRISEHTLRDWIYKRQIPVCRIRGRVRFRWSEIGEWLQGGSRGN